MHRNKNKCISMRISKCRWNIGKKITEKISEKVNSQ